MNQKQKIDIFSLLLLTLLYVPTYSSASSWILPPEDVDIFGQIQTTTANREETLLDIARRYDIGQDEMMLANPNVNRWLPEEGAEVVLPLRFIIPQAERTGLVINVPEMRLYYFPKPVRNQKPEVITYPVSIGRMDWNTPLGRTSIVRKQKDPTWTPPLSLKKEAIAEGKPPLQDVVLPGPDNPLGRYALYLGLSGYLIHSTNKPFGVGMRVTHGCMRLYPEDIEKLFNLVPTGTPVQIVNQPIKLGWQENLLFIELHPPLEEDDTTSSDYEQKVHDAISGFLEKTARDSSGNIIKNTRINPEILNLAIQTRNGIPTLISESLEN
ncbi:L,D-transpeptidase family protein [Nitrosomonas sp.]|uniref:L,D-transpeptidase family protein n=1 Tax=Nitrosomonas sp. TaxID=42353 RepID=UPI0025DDDB81|nr:L,D-transpeptidase family protein [Nitrosomonas sp.]